ncbi:unnamed protein product [Rangifer tarandus platyrhynchus]|uniref:Uncharacterized protein n=1 Tax=Rangifer tarandus platyrhynchus TaxID=3082113 RepID=A0ABN8ZGK6_RANTA|nr:unnamed protein product [Rangifer tarandus platyrhynchus]
MPYAAERLSSRATTTEPTLQSLCSKRRSRRNGELAHRSEERPCSSQVEEAPARIKMIIICHHTLVVHQLQDVNAIPDHHWALLGEAPGRTREAAGNLRTSVPTEGSKWCSARAPTAQAEDWTLDSKRAVKRVSHEGRARRQAAGGGAGTLNFRPRAHAALSPEDTAGPQVNTLPQVRRACLNRKPSSSPAKGPPAPIAQGTKLGTISPTL